MNNKIINVLYIVSTLRRSGPTNQLLGIIKNLDKTKFNGSVLTLSPEPKNSEIEKFLKSGIVVNSLSLSRSKYLLTGKKKLRNFLSVNSPDIIHTSGVRADVEISKIKFEHPHVMTIRNYVFDDYNVKFGKIVGTLASHSALGAMKRCDNVVFCSYSLKEMYTKHLTDKLYVVQNGVDTEKYSPCDDNKVKDDLKLKLGLEQNKKNYLMAGSLIDRKDPITVVEGFKKANTDGKSRLYILGEGELSEKINEIADDNIFVLGNVANIDEYYKASDVFISSSKSEGLPNAVLEAASCGLQLILSDIPQHREIFKNNMDLISLFPVGDTNKLSEKIIENQSNNISGMISRHVQNHFSTKKTSGLYQDLYQKVYG